MDAIGWTVSAVPEPGTATLFAFGLAGVAASQAKRFRRQSTS